MNELALAGVDTAVLERMHERTGLSKALNLQPRTAEVLDLRGLPGRAEQRSFATVADGHFAVIPVPYTARCARPSSCRSKGSRAAATASRRTSCSGRPRRARRRSGGRWAAW